MTLFQGPYAFLKEILPDDFSKQTFDQYYLDKAIDSLNIRTVVDLGCGGGASQSYFEQKDQAIKCIGVDIESSPEVDSRKKDDATFVTFDGQRLPFKNDTIDLIYSHNVLEHVPYPKELLLDVKRVLRPGGSFIGTTSHMEPYHSYSLWNYTPYGFMHLINESGMQLKELRPGIDALLLIIRKGLGNPRILNRFFIKETPLNTLIGLIGLMTGKGHKEINLLKIMFCGQFVFLVQK